MLHLRAFTFNPFQENTFLLYNDEKQAWIVDPGMYDTSEIQELKTALEEKQLVLQGIINTHAHIDHILGVQYLKDTYDIPFRLHEKELPVLLNARNTAAMFGFRLDTVPEATSFIREGEPLMLGDDALEVLFTPGHSPGSISFYSREGGWLIGGDVLFAGSIGRTDLPGGNHSTLLQSIRTQLFPLPDATRVFPGHGPATLIGTEKKSNPFFNKI